MTVRVLRSCLAAFAGVAFIVFSAQSLLARVADDKPASKEADKKDEKSEEPKTAEEAIKLGVKAIEKEDVSRAADYFAKAVKLDDKNRTALLFLARAKMLLATQAQGKKQYALFKESAQAMKSLREAHPKLTRAEGMIYALALYNEACALSIDNEPQKALASLKDAFATGFDDIAQLEKDEDLVAVRKLPEYEAFKKGLVEKSEKAAAEKVSALFKEAKSFPFDFELKNLDGKAVKLSDFKGKVTIVDVWGTWCPPCRKEIPHFVDLHAKYKAKGLEIVGINYEGGDDPKDDIKKIKEFVKENKVPYDCVLGDQATQALIPDFQGYPTTLFLDRTGKVRLKLVGYTPMPELEGIVKFLLEEDTKTTASR